MGERMKMWSDELICLNYTVKNRAGIQFQIWFAQFLNSYHCIMLWHLYIYHWSTYRETLLYIVRDIKTIRSKEKQTYNQSWIYLLAKQGTADPIRKQRQLDIEAKGCPVLFKRTSDIKDWMDFLGSGIGAGRSFGCLVFFLVSQKHCFWRDMTSLVIRPHQDQILVAGTLLWVFFGRVHFSFKKQYEWSYHSFMYSSNLH